MTNEQGHLCLVLRHWDFFRHSSFVIRIFPVLLLLAGCATPSDKTERVPNWENKSTATQPARQPVAPPASNTTTTTGKSAASVQSPISASATSAPPAHFSETWILLDRWCNATGHTPPERLATKPSAVYALHAPNGT